jgi:hypothetical protein
MQNAQIVNIERIFKEDADVHIKIMQNWDKMLW